MLFFAQFTTVQSHSTTPGTVSYTAPPTRRSDAPDSGVFWLHIGATSVLVAIIAYLLNHREDATAICSSVAAVAEPNNMAED